MKISSHFCILLLTAAAVHTLQASGESRVTSAFNPSKVILPSSQYTSDEPYTADVWVFNDGRRYDSAYYNQVLGEPAPDSEGRMWYEPSYELTDSEYAWQQAPAPFSYDENPVIYLNGTRIWSASGWNDNNYAEITLDATQRALLRQGDNVLAASLTQGGGGGHIDYGLKIIRPFEPSGISLPGTGRRFSSTADTTTCSTRLRPRISVTVCER